MSYGNGAPIGLNWNNTDYYYYKNVFGDVLGIMTANGTMVVRYTYDAWGNPISTTGTMSGSLGRINPFCYRGYYYDVETGYYYLQARYYNPNIGRFISADPVLDTNSAVGLNLYAYCGNDPVNFSDSSGLLRNVVTMSDSRIFERKQLQDVISALLKKANTKVNTIRNNVIEDVQNFNFFNDDEEKVLQSHYFSAYKGVPVFRIGGNRSGTVGMMFLTRESNKRPFPKDVVRHEYGHAIQFAMLGPVRFLTTIGIPSALDLGTGEYYDKPWEITADIFGGVESRKHPKEKVLQGAGYFALSLLFGVWG